MKAIVLCAGFGTRLYPLTRTTPKPLLPVAGKPVVEHLVAQLAATPHIRKIVLVCNGRFFELFRAWRDAVAPRLAIPVEVLNDGAMDNEHRLGAVRDLAWAVSQEQVREPSAPVQARGRRSVGRGGSVEEAVLVAAGDNLFRFAMEDFLEDHRANPRHLILRYRETDPRRLRRRGVAEVDASGRVMRFWEKPDRPESHWAIPALYVLEAAALALLDPFLDKAPDADAIGSFIAWLAAREPVFTHEMRGRCLDVGDPQSYREAEAWLKEASHGAVEPPEV